MPKVRVLSRQELDGDRAVALAEFVPVLLAEGDSWFAAGAVPAHNVLQALDFNSHGAVVNLAALPGDHLALEAAVRARAAHRRIHRWTGGLLRFVSEPTAHVYDAIVLSAGGADLIDALPHLLKRNRAGHCVAASLRDAIDEAALAAFDRYLRANLTDLVAALRERGGVNRDVPVFCHTYDVATANDAPPCIAGVASGSAWLQPTLRAAQLAPDLWQPLINHLFGHLAATFKALDLPDFHVVSTQGLLERARVGARGESGDWENEWHPNTSGWRTLAHKLAAAIGDEIGLQ